MWSTPLLGYHDGVGYTIRDALHYWYWNVSDTGEGVAFRDTCSTPHCSNSCPEEIVLVDEGETEMWSVGARVTIGILVLLIGLISLTMKVSHTRAHTHTHTHAHTHAHTHKHTQRHFNLVCTRPNTLIHINLCMHDYIVSSLYSCIAMCGQGYCVRNRRCLWTHDH